MCVLRVVCVVCVCGVVCVVCVCGHGCLQTAIQCRRLENSSFSLIDKYIDNLG